MRQRLIGFSAFVLGVALSGSARADGGYFDGVKGASASGRGGAFVARADDVSAVELNPAGLTQIGTTIVQVGNRFSYNQRTFTRNATLDWGQQGSPPYVAFGEAKNQAPWQVLDPFVGIASNFGLEDWAFAFAAFSPAGVARETYPEDGGQRYMMVRRNAQIIDYSLSAAWKFRQLFGVGASLQWIAVPTLDYSLIINGSPLAQSGNPVTGNPDIRADVTGSDLFTLNAVLGAWVRPTPNLQFGISGQILPSEIDTKSTLNITLLNPKPDDQPPYLTRGTNRANDVSLSLPLPMNVRLGARYRSLQGERELFDVELDGVYETWSRVKQFRLDSNGLVANFRGTTIPIGVIDIAKDWQNTIGVHLGGDVNVLPDELTVRGGIYYETPVAKPAYSNVDFSDGAQIGGALGASVYIGKVEISVATEYRVQPKVYVSDADARVYQQVPGSQCPAPYTDTASCNAHYLGIPAPPVNGGSYTAFSLIGTLEGIYRF
jgi:long-chain fatty acid transport protein